MLLAIIRTVAVVVLTVGTALFVAAEFSLVAADRAELEAASRDGDRAASRALAAVRTLSFQLSGAQLGITVTSLVVGFLAEPSITTLVRPALAATGLPNGAVGTVGVVGALLIATVLQMMLGELIPKNWAIARPVRVARLVAAPMRTFTTALRPLIAACNGLANLIVRRLGIEPREELRSARSPAELGSLVRTSVEHGTLPRSTAMLIARSISFGGKVAGEVMTPRTRVVALPDTASITVLLEQAAATGHSRFPVTSTAVGHVDLDAVEQVVHVKTAFTIPRHQRDAIPLRGIAQPLPRVPESMRLEPLMALLRRPGLQMAAVIDEYGGTAGIVTLEDAVEELVGDVADEHDPASAVPTGRPDGSLELPASLRVDEAAEIAPGFSAPRPVRHSRRSHPGPSWPAGPPRRPGRDRRVGAHRHRRGRAPHRHHQAPAAARAQPRRGTRMTFAGLLVAVALLLANALFVAAEFAAVSARRAQIEPLAATRNRAWRVLDAQRRLSLLLAGAQLGITLCSLGLGAVAEPTVARLFETALHALHLPADLADPLAFTVALALVVLLHMVLGEMVPKNIALAGSERTAILLVPALDTFVRLTRLPLRALNAIANGALRLMRVEPQDELKAAYTPTELAGILAESRHRGLLAAGEHDRLARALSLQRRTAADVLIPLDQLITVTPRTTAAELEELTARTGFSRFPVVDDQQKPVRLLGFLHVKDILTPRWRHRAGSSTGGAAPTCHAHHRRAHLAARRVDRAARRALAGLTGPPSRPDNPRNRNPPTGATAGPGGSRNPKTSRRRQSPWHPRRIP